MKVNLLPPELRPAANKRLKLIWTGALAVVILAVPLYYGFSLHAKTTYLQTRQLALQERLAELRLVEKLLAERNSLQNELTQVQADWGGKAGLAATLYLRELVRLLPEQVVLTELVIDGNLLFARGVTPDYRTAAALLEYLAGSEYFANPSISYLSAEQNGHRFELSAEIRAGGGQ